MPWIEGPTWTQVISERRPLPPEQSLLLAHTLVDILVRMEERGLAHCDLSGSNVLLPALSTLSDAGSYHSIELVDVEQLYSSDLKRPEVLTVASAGYAHKSAPQDLWSAISDRFAGAVLLTEMLGWCDAKIRDAAWGESYFAQDEMQKDNSRYQSLATSLETYWGHTVATLFERAWNSETLLDCPTFGEWVVALPETALKRETSTTAESTQQEEKSSGASKQTNEAIFRVLMDVARRLEEQGNVSGALENYRQAQTLVSQESTLANELTTIIRDLSDKVKEQADREIQTTPLTDASTPTPTLPPTVTSINNDNTEDPLAGDLSALFDDGLSAFQNDKWREAAELLGEVVRRSPEYTRNGWRARKLLADACQHARPFWQRALSYGMRILVSALLVLVLVTSAFTVAYLTLVRPVVTDALFTFARPLLHELTYVSGDSGCWTVTEETLNQSLAEMVPTLVERNGLFVNIGQGYFRASATIADYPIWLVVEPPTGNSARNFALNRVSMSRLLQILFAPDDLAAFINEYVADEIIASGRFTTFTLDLYTGQVMVCAHK